MLPAAPAPPLKVRWSFKPKDRSGYDGGPAIVGDTVYVADNQAVIRALDLATGKERWAYDGGEAFYVSPLVTGGTLYAGDAVGKIHAVDAATGKLKWTFDAQAGVHAHAAAAKIGGVNAVLVGTDTGNLWAIATEGKQAGTALWTAKSDDRINSAPAIAGDTAYIAACDFKLRAIDLATGKETGAFDAGKVIPGSPVVDGDSILISTDGGQVLAVDRKTLKQQWMYADVAEGAMIQGTAASSEGIVIVGADDRAIHAIDRATGKRKWISRARDDVDSSPVIAGGRVYIAGKDARLFVLDLKKGDRLFTHTMPKGVVAPIAVTDSVVVVADTGGTVVCLEAAR